MSRLVQSFLKLKQQLDLKKQLFQSFFAFSLFWLFFGFVCGNLFGTFLQWFRTYIVWDGFIIMLTILTVEAINYLYFYRYKQQPVFHLRLFNFYKIGLLLGFFTDAFKVGS